VEHSKKSKSHGSPGRGSREVLQGLLYRGLMRISNLPGLNYGARKRDLATSCFTREEAKGSGSLQDTLSVAIELGVWAHCQCPRCGKEMHVGKDGAKGIRDRPDFNNPLAGSGSGIDP